MMKTKFIHKISKGSRFNQIYIPKEAESEFEVGDLVEVKLLEKKVQLFYSKNLKKLSNFKETLIKDIFSFLNKFKEIEQIFVFGSFLTREIDYNDIDILIISEKSTEDEIYQHLIKRFNLKFHVISVNKKKLEEVLEICPLIRSMLYYFVSDKPYSIKKDTKIDKNHIRFLLMLPQDLLEVDVNSKMFYDALRRLLTIELFLQDKEIDPNKIDEKLTSHLEKPLLEKIRNNKPPIDKDTRKIRSLIKDKLLKIEKLL